MKYVFCVGSALSCTAEIETLAKQKLLDFAWF